MDKNPFGNFNNSNPPSNPGTSIPSRQPTQKFQFPIPSQPTNVPPSYPPPSLFFNTPPQPVNSNSYSFQSINSQQNYGIPAQTVPLNPPSSSPYSYPPPSLFGNVQQAQKSSNNNNLPSNMLPPVSSSFQNNFPPQQPFNFNTTLQQQQISLPNPNPQNLFQPSRQNRGFGEVAPAIKLLKEKEANKKVVALIVTFCSCVSYDQLFTQVQQKTLEGTQVLVYSCNSDSIKVLIKAFEGEEVPQSFKGDEAGKKAIEIAAHAKQIDPDCTVFNWECSSGYSDESFPEGNSNLMNFLKLILSKGHMAMFSDFSLKALINSWDATILGKNPFKRTGVITGLATLKFKPSVLKECPSSQLQLLGDLVEEGRCNIHCASNTILYTVDKQSIDNRYILQVLTIHLTQDNLPAALLHDIDGEVGDAGHVLLRYPSGGMILTSMGHWIELMKIDPSEKKLFEVAQREFGFAFAQQMQNEYQQLNPAAQAQFRSSNATTFVQNQAPCSNMNRKNYN